MMGNNGHIGRMALRRWAWERLMGYSADGNGRWSRNGGLPVPEGAMPDPCGSLDVLFAELAVHLERMWMSVTTSGPFRGRDGKREYTAMVTAKSGSTRVVAASTPAMAAMTAIMEAVEGARVPDIRSWPTRVTTIGGITVTEYPSGTVSVGVGDAVIGVFDDVSAGSLARDLEHFAVRGGVDRRAVSGRRVEMTPKGSATITILDSAGKVVVLQDKGEGEAWLSRCSSGEPEQVALTREAAGKLAVALRDGFVTCGMP